MRALQHVADGAVQPQLAALADIAPVDEHLPGRRLEEAAREFTSVDLPAPVSPTMAIVDPAGIFRLKCDSTSSLPSG